MAREKDTEIDQRFFVPDNIVDIRRTQVQDDYDYSGIVDDNNPESYPKYSLDFLKLPTPQAGVKIIQQTPKISPDGTITVDVVLELPDQDQNVEYEAQITKVS